MSETTEAPPEIVKAFRDDLEERHRVLPTPIATQVRLLEEQSIRVSQMLSEVLCTLRLPQNREAMASEEHRVELWRLVDRWYEQARPWFPKDGD